MGRMTTSLRINDSNTKEVNLHYIPAEVHHDGKANIKSYFETSIQRPDTNRMTASLRGRPLQGEEFEIPSGYTGLVFTETRKAITDEDERELTASHSFKSFNYWNLDREPSEQDKLQQAVQWMDIGKALHEPVDASDSQWGLRSEPSM